MKDKKLKVLQLVDTYLPTFDGVINVVKNYCQNINSSAECSLGASSIPKKSKYKDDEEFEIFRCKSVSAPEGYRYCLPWADRAFKKRLKTQEYDIIHSHTPFALGRMVVKISKQRQIPLVATLHTQYHQDFQRVLGKNNPCVKIMLRYIMKAYNGADSVWTVSETSKKILRMYGYKGDIEVIRNATDYVYPQNPQELIDRVNKLHGLEGQKNIFLFVGRMSMYKNLKLMCNALKIVKEHGEDFKMIFVGGGFDFEELKRYTKRLGIENQCILTGAVNDRELLQGYYLRSDLLLFPSVFDMASIVQVEASAHKKAAVVIKDSCAAEQIIDGENGFISDESEQAYAQKLIDLCHSPELMCSAGQKAYETLYRTWDMVGVEVVEKYKEIIKKYNANKPK